MLITLLAIWLISCKGSYDMTQQIVWRQEKHLDIPSLLEIQEDVHTPCNWKSSSMSSWAWAMYVLTDNICVVLIVWSLYNHYSIILRIFSFPSMPISLFYWFLFCMVIPIDLSMSIKSSGFFVVLIRRNRKFISSLLDYFCVVFSVSSVLNLK